MDQVTLHIKARLNKMYQGFGNAHVDLDNNKSVSTSNLSKL